MLIDERDAVVGVGLGVGRIGVNGYHVRVGDHVLESFADLFGWGVRHSAHADTCFFFLTSLRLF